MCIIQCVSTREAPKDKWNTVCHYELSHYTHVSLHMLQAVSIICYQTDSIMKVIDSECTVLPGVVCQAKWYFAGWYRERGGRASTTGAGLNPHATQVLLSKISAVSQLHNRIQHVSGCVVLQNKWCPNTLQRQDPLHLSFQNKRDGPHMAPFLLDKWKCGIKV